MQLKLPSLYLSFDLEKPPGSVTKRQLLGSEINRQEALSPYTATSLDAGLA